MIDAKASCSVTWVHCIAMKGKSSEITALERFIESLAILNSLPPKLQLKTAFARVSEIDRSTDKAALWDFVDWSVGFFESLNERLVEYLGTHAPEQSVLGWWDELQSLSTERASLRVLVRQIQSLRRGKPVRLGPNTERVVSGDSPPIKAGPQKGGLADWFRVHSGAPKHEESILGTALTHLDRILSLGRTTHRGDILLRLTPTLGPHAVGFKEQSVLLLLSQSHEIDIDRLKLCPICRSVFYAKKIGPKRTSLTCGIKRCADTLGNLKRRHKKAATSRSRAVIKIRSGPRNRRNPNAP
jgi:hypothetical protein